jgi:hypothetical protein
VTSTKTRSTSSASKRKKAAPVGFEYPQDDATLYALAVDSGEEMAGPHVRNACARHLRDLREGHARGLVWSMPSVDRVLRFFRNVLKLNGGDFEGPLAVAVLYPRQPVRVAKTGP